MSFIFLGINQEQNIMLLLLGQHRMRTNLFLKETFQALKLVKLCKFSDIKKKCQPKKSRRIRHIISKIIYILTTKF